MDRTAGGAGADRSGGRSYAERGFILGGRLTGAPRGGSSAANGCRLAASICGASVRPVRSRCRLVRSRAVWEGRIRAGGRLVDEEPLPGEEPLPSERRRWLVASSLACVALIAAGALVLSADRRSNEGGVGGPARRCADHCRARPVDDDARGSSVRLAETGDLTAGDRTVNRAARSRVRSRSGVRGGRRGTRRRPTHQARAATGSGADASRAPATSTITGAGVSVSTTGATTTPATQSTSGTSDQSAGAVGGARSGVGAVESTTSVAGLPAPGGPPAP